MKRIVSVILIAVLAVSVLASCRETDITKTEGGEKTAVKEYVSDKAADDVMAAAITAVSTAAELSEIDEMYFQYMIKVTAENAESYSIKLQPNGTTLDEVGIIKAASGKADSAQAEIKAYLAERNAAWTGLYLTEEYPKLKDAEVKVYGDYVVYAILSESEKAAFFAAAENAVTK